MFCRELADGWWLIRWLLLADCVLLMLLDGTPDSQTSIAYWISLNHVTAMQILAASCFAASLAWQHNKVGRWWITACLAGLAYTALTSPHFYLARLLIPYAIIEAESVVTGVLAAKLLACMGLMSLVLGILLVAAWAADDADEQSQCILLFGFLVMTGGANLGANLIEAFTGNLILRSLSGGLERSLELVSASCLVGCYANRLTQGWRPT